MNTIAIVGAGLSGLAAAQGLVEAGCRVTIFEKARGPGGRMSTRRTPQGSFNHGAQYFTARSPEFWEMVAAWLEDGVVAEWTGRVVGGPAQVAPRYRGIPGMSSVCRHLGRNLDVRLRTRVVAIEPRAGAWLLNGNLGPFDAVVVSAPAPQAAALLHAAPALAAHASAVRMMPCLAVMATGRRTDFDGAFLDDSPLAWVARDGERWILHATPEWSAANLKRSPEAAAADLCAAFRDVFGVRLNREAAHRWRYARASDPLGEEFLWDDDRLIGACGDWCLGARVEQAFLSGTALTRRILSRG